MNRSTGAIVAACALASLNVGLRAQQNPSGATSTAPAAQVIVTGCVQTETEYRKERDKGRGGPAGTGLGSANEFVLIKASPSRSASETAGTSGSNTAAGTMTYELTGSGEAGLAKFLNQRVEVTGTLKAQEIGPSGPTGGPTAKLDVVSEDLKVRELSVTSVRAATGACQ